MHSYFLSLIFKEGERVKVGEKNDFNFFFSFLMSHICKAKKQLSLARKVDFFREMNKRDTCRRKKVGKKV